MREVTEKLLRERGLFISNNRDEAAPRPDGTIIYTDPQASDVACAEIGAALFESLLRREMCSMSASDLTDLLMDRRGLEGVSIFEG